MDHAATIACYLTKNLSSKDLMQHEPCCNYLQPRNCAVKFTLKRVDFWKLPVKIPPSQDHWPRSTPALQTTTSSLVQATRPLSRAGFVLPKKRSTALPTDNRRTTDKLTSSQG